MHRLYKGHAKKVGQAPGTLVYVGRERKDQVNMKIHSFKNKEETIKKLEVDDISKLHLPKGSINWINVDGVHQTKIVEAIGKRFKLHPLLLEDILDTKQRPKLDEYDDYVFFVAKLLTYDEDRHEVRSQQVSLLLKKNVVISFKEKEVGFMERIDERLIKNKDKISNVKADYLLYTILDAIVDRYFIILENLGEDIERLEDNLLKNPSDATLKKIMMLKREVLLVRRAVWPLRDAINKLMRVESRLIKRTTYIYLNDVSDHITRSIDIIENFREIITSMLDTYLSSVSNRMNNVMKVLTVIATIFIPLTFITGLYGMNFKYMPELEHTWGYPTVLIVMVLIAWVMIMYFKKKNWW